MPDKRSHRGAHPEDAELFAPQAHERLRQAVRDLSWLLTGDYAEPSALKVVGDRYNLTARQRTAVMRSACGDAALADRLSREVAAADVAGKALHIDAYNVLTTIEAALGRGVILHARDTTFRDMASIHGSYRKVEETLPALELAGQSLLKLNIPSATWYLDQPVSNSGRLKTIMSDIAESRSWRWDIQIVPDPDAILARSSDTIASADSVILNRCRSWFSLAKHIVTRHVPDAWVVDLR
jgi:hypothetical protein